MPRDRTIWDLDIVTPDEWQRQAQLIRDIEEIRRRTPPPAPTRLYRNHAVFETLVAEPAVLDNDTWRQVRYGGIRELDTPSISKSDYQYGENFS